MMLGAATARKVLASLSLMSLAVISQLLAMTSAVAASAPMRLNDIQILGSHNSYKLAMPAENFAALSTARPEVAASLEYSHRSLPEQLNLGIRKLELDVFYDPDGGLFPDRASASQFPVLHVQNLDDRSHCGSLVHCLTLLRTWSEQHPRHVPVFVSFNAKDAAIEWPGAITPLIFGEDAWQAMDHELRTVLGPKLITPAEVFASGELNGLCWMLPGVDLSRCSMSPVRNAEVMSATGAAERCSPICQKMSLVQRL
jgi:hypothetical protein